MRRYGTTLFLLTFFLCLLHSARAQVDAGVPPLTAEGTIQTVTDLQHQVAVLRAAEAAHKAGGDALQMHVALAGILATIFRFLIQVANKILEFEPKTMRFIPWVTLVLGALVGVCAKFAGGVPIINAIILAGAGPGAIIVNALLKRKKKQAPKYELPPQVVRS